MFIQLDPGGGWSLVEPDNFTAFHIVAPVGTVKDPSAATVAAWLGAGTRPAGHDEVWVPLAEVRTAAGEDRGEEWEAGFAAMVGYATSNGWVDESGEALKAHLTD